MIYTFLGSISKPCCIQDHVIMNSVIKKFVCFNIHLFIYLFSLSLCVSYVYHSHKTDLFRHSKYEKSY